MNLFLVTGGSKFKGTRLVFEVLDRLHLERNFTHMVHGDAAGVDTMAHRWSKKAGVQPVAMEALWDYDGDPAGTKRNQRMWDLFQPKLVVAFPGARGTANMMRISFNGGAEVIDVGLIDTDNPNPIEGIWKT